MISAYNVSIYVSNKYDAYAVLQMIDAVFAPGGTVVHVKDRRLYLSKYVGWKKEQILDRLRRKEIKKVLPRTAVHYDKGRVSFVKSGSHGSLEDLQFTYDCLLEQSEFQFKSASKKMLRKKSDKMSRRQLSKQLMRAGVEMNPGVSVPRLQLPQNSNTAPVRTRYIRAGRASNNAARAVSAAAARATTESPTTARAQMVSAMVEHAIEERDGDHGIGIPTEMPPPPPPPSLLPSWMRARLVVHEATNERIFQDHTQTVLHMFEQAVSTLPKLYFGWATESDLGMKERLGWLLFGSHVQDILRKRNPYVGTVRKSSISSKQGGLDWLEGGKGIYVSSIMWHFFLWCLYIICQVLGQILIPQPPDVRFRVLSYFCRFWTVREIFNLLFSGPPEKYYLWRLSVQVRNVCDGRDLRNPYNRGVKMVSNEILADVKLEGCIASWYRFSRTVDISSACNVRWGSVCNSCMLSSSVSLHDEVELGIGRMSRQVATNIPASFIPSGYEQQAFCAVHCFQRFHQMSTPLNAL
jgi:hypothetical protein